MIENGESITTPQDFEYTGIILKGLATHPTAFSPNNTKNAEKVNTFFKIMVEYDIEVF